MQVIIGVDQGSSHTRAAVARMDGTIEGLGTTHGGYGSWEPERAMGAIVAAVAQARAQAGHDALTPARLLYGGLTGADWPDEYEFLHAHVSSRALAEEVVVVNDSMIALRGGTSQPYGAVVIAGTGANCALRAPDGRTFIYHYYVEDELQGGGALGRHALRAIYRAASGREAPTRLAPLVLALLEQPSVDALLRADSEQRLPASSIKEIAPLVFDAAVEGDEAACHILRGFGIGLAGLVTAGLRRLQMTDLPVEVVLSGSIFKGRGALLERVMQDEIRAIAPHAVLVNARYEPVVGAILLGLEQCGVVADEGVRARIEESAQWFGLMREKSGAPERGLESLGEAVYGSH